MRAGLWQSFATKLPFVQKPKKVPGALIHSKRPLWGDDPLCASELVWMTLGLSAKFLPRARAALADEA
jgi:hypothetical protein